MLAKTMSEKVYTDKRSTRTYHTNPKCRMYPDNPKPYTEDMNMPKCSYCHWFDDVGSDCNGVGPKKSSVSASNAAWHGHRKAILEKFGYEVND